MVDASSPRLGSHPEFPDYDGMALFTQADFQFFLIGEGPHDFKINGGGAQ